MSNKERKKLKRRFKYLLYKHIERLHFHTFDGFNQRTNDMFERMHPKYKNSVKKLKELNEFYQITDKLGIDDEMLTLIIREKYRPFMDKKSDLKRKPKIERKDNKRVKNYGGRYPCYGQSTIRYPSKKRSRATWARFYKLFPWAAKRDEWDGKTSKRMK